MSEPMLSKPCWVVDFLPEQVPRKSAGQFFAVEKYYLQQPLLADLHRRFTDILLKLNCYSDFLVSFPDTDQQVMNPAPDLLASWIASGKKDLCIMLPGENTLITLNHDDTCMTVFNPPEHLVGRIRNLAAASGLFLWQPPEDPFLSANR